MKFNGESSSFGKTILIWEDEIGSIKSTKDTTFHWYIQGEYIQSYTMQSVIQALYSNLYLKRTRKSDGRPFYIINIKNLVSTP